jgi:hypothetical protein
MRVSDFLGLPVLTESGDKLGHVFDLRVKRDPRSSSAHAGHRWQVKGLVVGRRGFIERFGLKGAKDARPLLPHDVVPWSALLRIRENRVIVRDGTKLE